MLQNAYPWIGIVAGLLVFALAMLWLIAAAGAGDESAVTERSPSETRHEVAATSVDELRSEAESALETAAAARANSEFDEAIDAHGGALAR